MTQYGAWTKAKLPIIALASTMLVGCQDVDQWTYSEYRDPLDDKVKLSYVYLSNFKPMRYLDWQKQRFQPIVFRESSIFLSCSHVSQRIVLEAKQTECEQASFGAARSFKIRFDSGDVFEFSASASFDQKEATCLWVVDLKPDDAKSQPGLSRPSFLSSLQSNEQRVVVRAGTGGSNTVDLIFKVSTKDASDAIRSTLRISQVLQNCGVDPKAS